MQLLLSTLGFRLMLQQWITRLRTFPRTKTGPIGLDFSRKRLHMVQFVKSANHTIELRSQMSVVYPCTRDELFAAPERLRDVISQGFDRGRFEGRSVVLGMPGGKYRTMPINYRTTSHQSDDDVISKLMIERLDGDVNDYIMDYIPVRSQARDAEKLAIVAVSERLEVTRFLDSLRRANLSVEALEIGPVAIRRLCAAMPSASSDMVLILNTGSSNSYLTMLSGRRLLMDQSVDFSEQRLLKTLSDALDIDERSAWNMVQRTGLQPPGRQLVSDHQQGETGIYNTLLEILKPEFNRLVEETDRAFMYASAQARGGGDAKILLFGSLARWRGADRLLSSMTHLPVTLLPNPLQSFGATSQENEETAVSEPEYAVAAGLALRGLLGDE